LTAFITQKCTQQIQRLQFYNM